MSTKRRAPPKPKKPPYEVLGSNVLVKVDKPDEITEGGIVLPQNICSADKMTRGVVIEIGCDIDIMCKKNDKVIFKDFSGIKITINNEELLVIDEKDVLIVLN